MSPRVILARESLSDGLYSQCWESQSVSSRVGRPGELARGAKQATPESPSLPEVLPPPRWGGVGGGARRADSRQFAWAVPADVYSQPWEEGGSHLYSAGGRGPSCHFSDQ